MLTIFHICRACSAKCTYNQSNNKKSKNPYLPNIEYKWFWQQIQEANTLQKNLPTSNIWGFQHITYSPIFSKCNGAVETEYEKKKSRPYMSLLAHIVTPIDCRYSLNELLMGRKLRTNFPIHPELLTPKWPNFEPLWERDDYKKEHVCGLRY